MSLYLREAGKEDIKLLYEWANDLEVRKNAFHTEQIAYATHKIWFENVLKSSHILQYILVNKYEEENNPQVIEQEIGQIRLSLEKERAIISYSITKDLRGQVHGAEMVLMAEEKIKTAREEIILCVAQVKYENAASAKVFEKCGYTPYRKSDYIEYTKKLKPD